MENIENDVLKKATTADILDKSSIRYPIHWEVRSLKRNSASHSDFLMKPDEILKLVEYEKMNGAAFLTHLFLEQSDEVMQKIATDILSSKPEGDIAL